MGSGKTVVGALVADIAGVPFHDLDFMIENEAGMAISDIFATGSEAAFRAIEARLLPVALEPRSVTALGGGTPIADANWRLIAKRSVSVFLDVSFETIWKRIGGVEGRPVAAGRSRAELEALLEQRRPRYEQADYRVDGDRSAEVVATETLKLWSA
jgi:shikimate kinase